MRKNYWHDPVWSKVIAGIILGIIAPIWAGALDLWLRLGPIFLWLLGTAVAFFLSGFILALRKQGWSSEGSGKPPASPGSGRSGQVRDILARRYAKRAAPSVVPVVSQIRILRDNVAILTDIADLQKAANIERVVIVQYSGANVKDIINQIWVNTSADIELYLGDPANAINEFQQDRIKDAPSKVNNDLDVKARGRGTLDIFTYQAPASIRAILIEGRSLYFGSYYYKVMKISKPKLDIRGGEMPLLAGCGKSKSRGWPYRTKDSKIVLCAAQMLSNRRCSAICLRNSGFLRSIL